MGVARDFSAGLQGIPKAEDYGVALSSVFKYAYSG